MNHKILQLMSIFFFGSILFFASLNASAKSAPCWVVIKVEKGFDMISQAMIKSAVHMCIQGAEPGRMCHIVNAPTEGHTTYQIMLWFDKSSDMRLANGVQIGAVTAITRFRGQVLPFA